MLIVHVKLFATLRRHCPHLGIGEPMPLEVPEQTTVGQLLDHLHLPADEVKIVFVNNTVRETGHVLHDGDEMGIFPPVGGG